MAEADFNVKAIISANTSQFNNQLNNAQKSLKSFSSGIEGIQKMLKTAFNVVGITASVGAIVNFGKQCVKSADEANRSFKVLENTIKVTGAESWTSAEELDKMAKAYAETTNFADDQVKHMESVLLGFKNISGETFKDATDAVLDMAEVMGMDLTSAAQTVGKALDDPVKGLDSLRRQGFYFTEEQKEELAQLVKNGKQMEAQKIILNELATVYGGAAKAGQSAFAKLQHAMDNFRENIGNKLLPVVNQVMNAIANAMTNIVKVINNSTGFDTFINVVVNLGKKVFEVLSNIINYFKETFNNIRNIIKTVNFSPLISVLDTLVGVVRKVFGSIKSYIEKGIESWKRLTKEMTNVFQSFEFQQVADFVNKFIDGFFFIYDQVVDIFDNIRTAVENAVINIWNKIKQIFSNSQKALANSQTDIKSWSDYFWSILNDVFRIAQDLVGMVKAIFQGDWAVAWEYAKLVVLRVVNVILDTISTLMNAFPALVNKLIDAMNVLVAGINKIRGFFGKDSINLIGEFSSIDLAKEWGLDDAIEKIEQKIEQLTGKAADITIQQLQGISDASKGFFSELVDDITETSDATQKETKKTYSVLNQETEQAAVEGEKYSKWDIELMKQKLKGLKDYSDEYHSITLELINVDRDAKLKEEENEQERVKINEYYDNEVLEENKRFEEAKLKLAKEGFEKVKDFAKKTADIAKKVFSGIVSVVKSVISSVKNIFSGFKNLFQKLFELDTDEALISLLEYEDKILTFFVVTTNKIGKFVDSAVSSVTVLTRNILKHISSDKVKGIINSIIDTITSNFPEIIENITNIMSNIVNGVISAIIGKAPDLISALIKMLKTVLGGIKEFLLNSVPEIIDTISQLIPIIVDTLVEILSDMNRVLKTIIRPLLNLFFDIFKGLIEALTDESVLNTFVDLLVEMIDTICTDIIPQLPMIIAKVISAVIKVVLGNLPRFIVAIVTGLIKGFFTVNWFEVVVEIFRGFIEGIKSLFGIHSPSKMFEGFGSNMVQGLFNGLKNIWNVVKNIFSNLVNNIKNVFSNLWNWTKNIFSNLVNDIKNVFSNLWNWTKNLFSNLGSGISNAVSTVAQDITGVAQNIGTGVKNAWETVEGWATNAWETVEGWATNAWSGVKSFFGFANGTNDAPRGIAMVGEAGPELVRFRGGEQVLNAQNTQKALEGLSGTSNNNFNVTFNNIKDTSAYEMMRQLKKYNRELAFNGVI